MNVSKEVHAMLEIQSMYESGDKQVWSRLHLKSLDHSPGPARDVHHPSSKQPINYLALSHHGLIVSGPDETATGPNVPADRI